jgi:hypothetical protein
MGDWDVIRAELDAAAREQRVLSDLAARVIATQYYQHQSSSLYALASTGAITDGWNTEIRAAAAHAEHDDERQALDALEAYCAQRPDKDHQAGWSSLSW